MNTQACYIVLVSLLYPFTYAYLKVAAGAVIYVSGVVVPFKTYQNTTEVSCQSVFRAKSDAAVDSTFGIIVPYTPKCRVNQPELFETRQCTEHDCFCVNATTGSVLIGTRASPSEVGDCSAAIYSILLAIHSPLFNVSASSSSDSASSTTTNDAAMLTKILHGFEQLLQTVTGFQQLVNITQLIMVPKLTLPSSDHHADLGRVSYYQADLVSVGHSSVRGPLDLIQHRLEEGHLPVIGSVDRDLSRVTLVKEKVKDPLIIWSENRNHPEPDLLDADNPSAPPNSNAPSRPIFPRSYEVNSFAPNPLRSPGEKVERDSRQLQSNTNSDTQLLGGVVAPSFSEETSTLHQTWQVRTSRFNILRQPGVIAGLVGSFVAGLLLLILLILFCIYRLRKKDEGSYALDEPKKRPPVMNAYQRAPTREFYA